MNTIKTILLSLCLLFATNAMAYDIQGTGDAVVVKGNYIAAIQNSLDNALLSSIRDYYRTFMPNNTPDITTEYLKFVQSYKLISRFPVGAKIRTRVLATLDTNALQDATLLITDPKDTAVFTHKGLTEDNISLDRLESIIASILIKNDFTLQHQDNFLYNINDSSSNAQVSAAFRNVDSKNMFRYTFKINHDAETFDNESHRCELQTTISVFNKGQRTQTIQLKTGSNKYNKNTCLRDSITEAVNKSTEYIRENLVARVEVEKTVHTYKLKAINFNNMIITNQLLSNLKERGFISNFKTSSFATNEVIFEVQTYFVEDTLVERLSNLSLDIGFMAEKYADGIILDFEKTPATDNTTASDNVTPVQ